MQSNLCRLAVCSAVMAVSAPCTAQSPPVSGVYAVVGAKIEIGDGRVIEKGTVVVRNGVITDVGADVKVPADAEILKGDGLTVYPGFIDAYTTKGVNLPEIQPNQDTPPDTSAIAPAFMREANRKGIRPELKAADVLTVTDDVARPARSVGFLTEYISPSGGTINGVGALVNLNGLPRRDSVVSPTGPMDFAFGTSGGGYPNSPMGIIAITRQTLYDAGHYRAMQTSFNSGGSVRPPDDPVLQALQPVISRQVPALYLANSEREIRRAASIAAEFRLNLWINGGLEAYKTVDLLKRNSIPVIVSLNFGQDPMPADVAPAAASSPSTGGPTPPATAPPSAPGGPAGAMPGGGQRPGGGRRRGAGGPDGSGAPGAPAGPGGPATPGAAPAAEPDPTPKEVLEERHKKWEEKQSNAAKLNAAGVPFAFSTQGLRSPAEFFPNLRKAIKAGLPREAALKALTINAAKLFHVDGHLGTVEKGKTASLVIMTGDFADEKSTVKAMIIDSVKFEPSKDTGPLIQMPARRRPGGDDDDN